MTQLFWSSFFFSQLQEVTCRKLRTQIAVTNQFKARKKQKNNNKKNMSSCSDNSKTPVYTHVSFNWKKETRFCVYIDVIEIELLLEMADNPITIEHVIPLIDFWCANTCCTD